MTCELLFQKSDMLLTMFEMFLVVPRYPHPNTENEQWMTWIDRNISQSSHGFETVGGFLQGIHSLK